MAYRVPPSGPKNPALVVHRVAPGAPRKQTQVKSRLSNAEKAGMKNYENYGNIWPVEINDKIPVGNSHNKNTNKNLSWANRPPTKKNKGGRRKTVRRNKHY
jgi:hypothetical protein